MVVWGYTGPYSRPRKSCGCLEGSTCNCVWYSTQAAVDASAIEELSNEEEPKEKPKRPYKMCPVVKCSRRIIQIQNTRAAVKRFAPRRLQRFS